MRREQRMQVLEDLAMRLGLVPGSVIEWEAEGDAIVVRRGGKFSSLDIHRAVFGDEPPVPVTLEEMDAAIAAQVSARHARR